MGQRRAGRVHPMILRKESLFQEGSMRWNLEMLQVLHASEQEQTTALQTITQQLLGTQAALLALGQCRKVAQKAQRLQGLILVNIHAGRRECRHRQISRQT